MLEIPTIMVKMKKENKGYKPMPSGVKQKKENSLSQAHNFRRGSFSILNSQFLILMTPLPLKFMQ